MPSFLNQASPSLTNPPQSFADPELVELLKEWESLINNNGNSLTRLDSAANRIWDTSEPRIQENGMEKPPSPSDFVSRFRTLICIARNQSNHLIEITDKFCKLV